MQAIFGSTGGNLFSSAECRIRTRVSGTESPADGMPADKPTDLAANGQAITNIVHSVFEFCFNTTQHKTILYTSLQWFWYHPSLTMDALIPHSLHLRATYGMSMLNISGLFILLLQDRRVVPSVRRGCSLYSMMMSSNGNIFRVTGLLCGEFTGPW